MRMLNSLADRMVRLVVPKVEAAAACSGCWVQCNVYGCPGASGALWRCCYKANCTDTCSRIGTCYC